MPIPIEPDPRLDNMGLQADPKQKALEDNWRHRSEIMKCRTCMWFAPKQGTIGRCRRRSPTMSGWPVLFETDWCGDHKLNENVL